MLNSQARVFPTMLFFPALVWLGSYCWPYEHSCKILYKKKVLLLLTYRAMFAKHTTIVVEYIPMIVSCVPHQCWWLNWNPPTRNEHHRWSINESNPKEKMIQSTIVDHQSTIHQSCMTSPQTLFMRSYDPVCINISVMSPLYI